MDIISHSTPPPSLGQGSINAEEKEVKPEKSAKELDPYRISMPKEDGVRKSLNYVTTNVRNNVRVSRDLSIYCNSEYV